MSVSSQQNYESTATAENTDSSLNRSFDNKARGRATTQALQKNCSSPPVRKKKVLAVRQQLAEGTYCIDERLSVALERFLEYQIA